tara:strand:+ start:1640 stop:2719 length:1080 start_codon:yes stop_codon:yes gene_type:complete
MTKIVKALYDTIHPEEGLKGNIVTTPQPDSILHSIFPDDEVTIEFLSSGTLLYHKLERWIYPIDIHNLTYINFLFHSDITNNDMMSLLSNRVRHGIRTNKGTVLVIVREPLSGDSNEIKHFVSLIEKNPDYKNVLFLTLHHIDSPNFLYPNILADTMYDWSPTFNITGSNNYLEGYGRRRYSCFLMNYKESNERTVLLKYLEKHDLFDEGFVSATNYTSSKVFNDLDIATTLNKTLLNIIPEGSFLRTTHPFLSEKTYRSFLFKKPFIYLGQPRFLQYIKSLGYRTFNPIINEKYDEIIDNKLRVLYVCKEIKRLMNRPLEEFVLDMSKLQEICEHNYNLYITIEAEQKAKLYNRVLHN